MTSVRTYSGHEVSLSDPHPASINIRDIACALSRLNRFCGATRLPVNVADHSLNVVRYLAWSKASPIVQMLGLLHDAHEAFIGDITAPVRRRIRELSGRDLAQEMADRIDGTIRTAFGLQKHAPTRDLALVHAADQAVLAAEWRDLMEGPMPASMPLPAPFAIKPRTADQAEIAFLKSFDLLQLELGPITATSSN